MFKIYRKTYCAIKNSKFYEGKEKREKKSTNKVIICKSKQIYLKLICVRNADKKAVTNFINVDVFTIIYTYTRVVIKDVCFYFSIISVIFELCMPFLHL